MKIVGEYLVELPIIKGFTDVKIYKVINVSDDIFYREVWYGGNLIYEPVDKEVFYEQNAKKLG